MDNNFRAFWHLALHLKFTLVIFWFEVTSECMDQKVRTNGTKNSLVLTVVANTLIRVPVGQ